MKYICHIIISLKNNIRTFVPGGGGCRLKAYVHVQDREGVKSQRTYVMDDS